MFISIIVLVALILSFKYISALGMDTANPIPFDKCSLTSSSSICFPETSKTYVEILLLKYEELIYPNVSFKKTAKKNVVNIINVLSIIFLFLLIRF